MELRKIQVTGGSTHVISLPKKWVDRNGLGRSDALAIHEEPDGSLLVIPNGEIRNKKRRISIPILDSTSTDAVIRKLIGAYLAGADEIHIHSKGGMSSGLHDTIHAVLRDMVGVEVQDETPDSITLQDLVGVSDMDFKRTITRMHRIARIMFDDSLRSVQGLDSDLANRVSARDDELDRIEWMIIKQMHALLDQPRIAAHMDMRPAESLNYFLVARCLERMGDHASKICKNLLQYLKSRGNWSGLEEQELLADFMNHTEVIKGIWDDAFQALKKDDFDMANQAVSRGKELAIWKLEFAGKLSNSTPKVVNLFTILVDSVDRIRSYSIDIAEIAMNQTFQKV